MGCWGWQATGWDLGLAGVGDRGSQDGGQGCPGGRPFSGRQAAGKVVEKRTLTWGVQNEVATVTSEVRQ